MVIKKEIREQIWLKFDKHCAYCGKEIEYNELNIDHIIPAWHNDHKMTEIIHKTTNGNPHYIENYNPSCQRCNKWKSTWSVEQFRNEIKQQLSRLYSNNANYRLALDYGLIIENKDLEIKFYFEK